MGEVKRAPQPTIYRLNLCNPEIRAAYDAYKLRRGIPGQDPPSDREREEFEREWMAAYLAACRREGEPEGSRRLYAFGPVSLAVAYDDGGQALYQVEDRRTGGEPETFAHPLAAWSNFVDKLDALGRSRLGALAGMKGEDKP